MHTLTEEIIRVNYSYKAALAAARVHIVLRSFSEFPYIWLGSRWHLRGQWCFHCT